MFAVVVGSSIIFLDTTVVNLALEEIGRSVPRSFFGKLESQTYVYAAYLLGLSALLLPAGAWSDTYGRRRIFSLGLGGFGVVSVLCALAPDMETLILYRMLQGCVGALVVPGSLSILTAEFKGEDRGRAFGVWAAGSAAATLAGPLAGGLLIQWTSWKAAFYINMPLVLVALYATNKGSTGSVDSQPSPGSVDWAGSVLAGIALSGMVLGAVRGQQTQWKGLFPYLALATGLLSAAVLPWLIARSEHPLVPLHLFRSRNFVVTNISTLLIYGGIYAAYYFSPLYVQGTLGYDAGAAGIFSLPGWFFLATLSPRFGRMAVRHGPRFYMAAGPATMALGLLMFTRIPANSAAWLIDSPGDLIPPRDYLVHFLPGWIVFGVGLVMMVAPLTTALMTSVPAAHAGIASAFNNAISRVGPQLAGALIFVAVTGTFYGALRIEQPDLNTQDPSLRNAVSPLNEPEGDISSSLDEAIRRSSTEAFHQSIRIASALIFLGGVVNAIGIRNQVAPSDDGDPHLPPLHPSKAV